MLFDLLHNAHKPADLPEVSLCPETQRNHQLCCLQVINLEVGSATMS